MITSTFVSRENRADHVKMIKQALRIKIVYLKEAKLIANTNSLHYKTLERLITSNQARLQELALEGERWFSQRK